MTHCNANDLLFQDLGNRQVVARFDGGTITSDAGGLLLREVEHHFHFVQQFARCFTDFRDPDLIEHTLEQLLKQRLFALCLGYEDLNDHDLLRYDPLLALLADKPDPTGQDRPRQRDKGKALAGKSTLNRLELTPVRAKASSRYKKIVGHLDAMQDFFVAAFLQQQVVPPAEIILDLDTTDFPLHGQQLGRFFHGYYDSYCYLPLYIFCGDHALLALLRPSNIDASTGALKHLIRIIGRIRQVWPAVRIMLRGDSGFCREHLMVWCEANKVDYLFGLAKNTRLLKELAPALQEAAQQYAQTKQASRVFKDFTYSTLDSWSRARRVVGKAEHLEGGPNPRFVVTSLAAKTIAGQPLYEDRYCSRGDMENRIKEQQLMLFACRVSCATMRANQVRLCLATVAYIVLRALRQFGVRPAQLLDPSAGQTLASPAPAQQLPEQGIVASAEPTRAEGVPATVVELAAEPTPTPPTPTPPMPAEPTGAAAALESSRVTGGVSVFTPGTVVGTTAEPTAVEPRPAEPRGAAAMPESGDVTAPVSAVTEPTPAVVLVESVAAAPSPAPPPAASAVAVASLEACGGTLPAPASTAASPRTTAQTPAQPASLQCDTLRLRLLKIGAVVRVSVRRVYVSLSEAYPFRELFVQVLENLRRLRLPRPGESGGTG